jgi:hypothetical protein
MGWYWRRRKLTVESSKLKGKTRESVVIRLRLVFFEFKPRDLGDDRGYRVFGQRVVVVVGIWVRLSLKTHPQKTRVGHPKKGR